MNSPYVYAIEKDVEWRCDHCNDQQAKIGIQVHTVVLRLCLLCATKLSAGIERLA